MILSKINKLSSRLLLILIIVSSQIEVALAGFDQLVRDVFPAGTMVNGTDSAIVKEQAAGHLIGGSLIVKPPANPKMHLFRAQAPSCKLGGLPCAAQIELLGGSLSTISGEELMQYLKSIPGNAASYGAIMAVKTLCSQCQQVLEYLDSKADFLNRFSLDNCAMIQNIMDPVFAKMQAKSQALKQSDMLLTGQCADMSQCQSNSKNISNIDNIKSQELKSQLGDNYNLVWKALREKTTNDGLSNDFKELLMSISGTLIATKNASGNSSTQHIKSLVNYELIKQFIGADKQGKSVIKLYRCDEPEYCLKPKVKEVRVNSGAFLFGRIKKILASIAQKIQENKNVLNSEEEMLIALSSEQLILKMEMDLATYSGKHNVISNQHEYIEALAYEVITNYLQSLLIEAQQAVGELSKAQIADAGPFKDFEEEARNIMRILSASRREAKAQYDLIMKSKLRTGQELNKFQRDFESFLGTAVMKGQ